MQTCGARCTSSTTIGSSRLTRPNASTASSTDRAAPTRLGEVNLRTRHNIYAKDLRRTFFTTGAYRERAVLFDPSPGGWVAAEFPQLAPTVLALVEEGAVPPPLMRAAAARLLLRDAVALARTDGRRPDAALLLELFRLCEVVVPRDVNASARCARPACAAARQLDELSADALRRRRAAAPLSLVSRYRRSQRKAPRNYRRIAALVAPCTFAHFADQMVGTDES